MPLSLSFPRFLKSGAISGRYSQEVLTPKRNAAALGDESGIISEDSHCVQQSLGLFRLAIAELMRATAIRATPMSTWNSSITATPRTNSITEPQSLPLARSPAPTEWQVAQMYIGGSGRNADLTTLQVFAAAPLSGAIGTNE